MQVVTYFYLANGPNTKEELRDYNTQRTLEGKSGDMSASYLALILARFCFRSSFWSFYLCLSCAAQSHVLQMLSIEGNEIVTGKKLLIDIFDFHCSISFLILSPSFHNDVY